MTMPQIRVHFLPAAVDPAALAGGVTIVIDQLRASSTICQALASGAECVVPFLQVDEALAAADAFGRDRALLGGERHGKIIDRFDLGNSPLEYRPEVIAGRRLFFTTTNGTRAMLHARYAVRTLIGSALNRRAVAEAADALQVDILCAGTGGEETAEDILAAGAIAATLHELFPSGPPVNSHAGTAAALDAWEAVLVAAEVTGCTPSQQLAIAMRDAPGGRNLLEIGHDYDLEACAQLDSLDVVPELNHATGEIRPA
jgi:2-phosphosulfolactate phosphatase